MADITRDPTRRYITKEGLDLLQHTFGRKLDFDSGDDTARMVLLALPLARAHLEARESGEGLVGRLKIEASEDLDGEVRESAIEAMRRAAEALAAKDREIEGLREALKTTDTWLDRWAQHVGWCRGGAQCECGLEAVRYDVRTALRKDTQ